MFGMPFAFSKNNPAQTEAVRPGVSRLPRLPLEPELTRSVTWVTQEDIYSRVQPNVLLMKAGQKLSADMFQKLLNNGASREQFSCLAMPGSTPPDYEDPELAGLLPRLADRVLLLGTHDRTLERLMEGLTACGIPTPDIHPVLMLERLAWALEKYQATLVFIDQGMARQLADLNLWAGLKEHPGLKKIVITLNVPEGQSRLCAPMIEIAHRYGAELLYSPFSRLKLWDALTGLPGQSAASLENAGA